MLTKNIQKIIPIFNQNRINILFRIFDCKESLCGCDLVEKVKIQKNLLSYHINFLKLRGLILEKKCGQKKHYRLTDEGKAVVLLIKQIDQII